MYIKVHKKGNQWFRDDNGALVGNELKTNGIYQTCIIKSDDNHFFKPILGYVNQLGQFIPLCKAVCVPTQCELHKTEICFYHHKDEATFGYHISD